MQAQNNSNQNVLSCRISLIHNMLQYSLGFSLGCSKSIVQFESENFAKRMREGGQKNTHGKKTGMLIEKHHGK